MCYLPRVTAPKQSLPKVVRMYRFINACISGTTITNVTKAFPTKQRIQIVTPQLKTKNIKSLFAQEMSKKTVNSRGSQESKVSYDRISFIFSLRSLPM